MPSLSYAQFTLGCSISTLHVLYWSCYFWSWVWIKWKGRRLKLFSGWSFWLIFAQFFFQLFGHIPSSPNYCSSQVPQPHPNLSPNPLSRSSSVHNVSLKGEWKLMFERSFTRTLHCLLSLFYFHWQLLKSCTTVARQLLKSFFSSSSCIYAPLIALPLGINNGIFSFVPPPPPSTSCAPQLQSTCHYIVNHYVKIWHVRGGGGVQIIWAR